MKLLITPPFDSPIAPTMLDPRTELAPILAEYDVEVTDNLVEADLELVGYTAGVDPRRCRLPRQRVVLIDGEPPQPEYLLPHYAQEGYAAILTPANLQVYDQDCMACYEPPLPERPKVTERGGRIVQLATFRRREGNVNFGTHILVSINGRELFSYRVLCNLRVMVGLAIKQSNPELIDLYGRGWPEGTTVVEESRARSDFLEVRHQIASRYAFDLCWENVEIPYWVSEKFWSPVRMGVLPLYWGPSGIHELVPKDTLIDCRSYLHGFDYDVEGLVYDVTHMSFEEYARRTETLLDWYYSLPTDSHKQSWLKSAHRLGATLQQLMSSGALR